MTATPAWHKSSHSDDGNCVEVAHAHAPVLVRDSKNTPGPVLRFAPEQWNTFTGGVCRGDFTSPAAPAR